MNWELPDVQAGFRNGRGAGDQTANIHWIREEARDSRKTSISASLTMLKPLTLSITTNYGKFLKGWEYQTTLPASWETCMQVKKQQLEPDMEQWTDFKLGKEYVKNVSCHPAYSTCMQGTLWKMPAWMNHKLESRLPITSICRWHHHNGRKQRGTKKALDKSEREEWKIWLKINIQKKKKPRSWHLVPSLHDK